MSVRKPLDAQVTPWALWVPGRSPWQENSNSSSVLTWWAGYLSLIRSACWRIRQTSTWCNILSPAHSALQLRKSLNSKLTQGMPSGINLQKLITKEINRRQPASPLLWQPTRGVSGVRKCWIKILLHCRSFSHVGRILQMITNDRSMEIRFLITKRGLGRIAMMFIFILYFFL